MYPPYPPTYAGVSRRFHPSDVVYCEESVDFSNVSYRIEQSDGTICFIDSNHNLHRIGGPAIISPNGRREYQVHGKLHNEHGPAITQDDLPVCWALNDVKFTTQAKWEEAIRFQTVREIHNL